MGHYHQGKFSPKHPEKYAGNPNNIVYRSSWEARVYSWLDEEPNVITWGSEELTVPYWSPVDQKMHRYFPDVVAKVKTGNGTQIFMLEIKPEKQTKPPKQPKRKTKRFLNEVATYSVNTSKWMAAKKYCKEKGWQFKIITERTIFGKPNK